MTATSLQVRDKAAARLAECPRCAYPLVGLPAEHSCPECGLAYDAATRCWRVDRPWRRLLLLGIVDLVMVAIAVVAQRVYASFGLAPAKLWFGYGVMAIGLAQFAITLWAVRCRPFVAVLPDGLAWRIRGQTDHLAPWSAVRDLVIRPVGSRHFVHVLLDRRPWKLDVTSVLPGRSSAAEFAGAIRAQRCMQSSV